MKVNIFRQLLYAPFFKIKSFFDNFCSLTLKPKVCHKNKLNFFPKRGIRKSFFPIRGIRKNFYPIRGIRKNFFPIRGIRKNIFFPLRGIRIKFSILFQRIIIQSTLKKHVKVKSYFIRYGII